MTWQGDEWLDGLYREAERSRERTAKGETREARDVRLRDALRRSIGSFDIVSEVKAELLERVQCDGYVRERVQLSVVPGLSFAAYVLLPDGASGRLPCALAIHGHGYGSRQISGLRADGSPDEGEGDIYRHFAVQLVRKGIAVVAPDVIGFGERRMRADTELNPDAPSSCYRMASGLLMLGKTLTGLRAAELLGALDYAAGRSDVDASKIGVIGFSGGSLLAYVLAALDERIRAVVLMGFPNTFRASVLAVHHCLCNYTPGLLEEAELPDLMGLIAPRPLFLESGDRDPIFPEPGFREAVRQLAARYGEYGAADSLRHDVFPGVHEVSGRLSFDWLVGQLRDD